MLNGNKIGDKVDGRTIISKRLLNSKYKKSISYESCNERYVSLLDKIQFKALEKTLQESPHLLTELDNYEIPILTTIFNYDLQIDDDKDIEVVLLLINFIKNGQTFLDIESEMTRLDISRLKPKKFGNYKFQIFSFNEEYLDKRKIWRDAKLTRASIEE